MLIHPPPKTSVFDALPDSAFIREAQLMQSPARPDSTAPLPFSAPTLWRMVKAGTFPKPIKLSKRVTAWRVGDVRQWLADPAEYAHRSKCKLSPSSGVTSGKKGAAK
jgi:prophage regulatory protein